MCKSIFCKRRKRIDCRSETDQSNIAMYEIYFYFLEAKENNKCNKIWGITMRYIFASKYQETWFTKNRILHDFYIFNTCISYEKIIYGVYKTITGKPV